MTGLAPRFVYGDLDLTDYPFLVQFGSDLGAPDIAFDVLASELQVGDIEISSHVGNRTLSIPILIEGSDLDQLSVAEAALVVEADKARNTLTLDPGDGFGHATVYTTFRAELTYNRDDTREQGNVRSWTLTLRARPYGNSVAPVVAEALEAAPDATRVTPSTVVIDDGSSPTNWAANGLGGVVAGAYRSTFPSHTGRQLHVVGHSGSFSTAVTKFISVDYRVSSGADIVVEGVLTAFADGAQLTAVTAMPSLNYPLYTRVVFQVGPGIGTVTSLEFRHTLYANTPMETWLEVTELERTNVAPFVGTARQKIRTIPVAGSAPTEASLVISHPSFSLGDDVLAFTWRDDRTNYSPPLRARKTGGSAATPDANAISGATESISTGFQADVPIYDVPAGAGLLVARLRASVASTVNIYWSVTTLLNDNTLSTQVAYRPVTFPTALGWQFVTIAEAQFRDIATKPGSSAIVRFGLQRDPAATGVTVELDEAYHFNVDKDLGVAGVLSQVSCGTGSRSAGGPSSVLSIETATPDRPFPAYFRGTQQDGSDWVSANTNARSLPAHEFLPPSMRLLTVTPNALDASAVIRHFPAFHTHATQ